MTSRALALREGSAPVRDRLVMTIFLAAVLHGIVILGITFSSGFKPDRAAPGLEVLLVSNELPAAARNPTAAYLAQRTQLGSGNTRRAVAPRNRAGLQALVGHAGVADGESLASDGTADAGADAIRVLATTAPQLDVRYVSDPNPGSAPGAKPLLVPDRAGTELGPSDDVGPVELRGPRRTDLWITADSRKATLAPYLAHWRERIERVGTLNFPVAARHAGIRANPVIEVQIGADGRLEAARITRSSGYPDLDNAALQILKLASPFNPFPPELSREYRTLRFSYEWEFVGGRIAPGAVSAAP